MKDLIAKLEAAPKGSWELSDDVFDHLHPRPLFLVEGGKASISKYSRDTTVCDVCLEPATIFLDRSLQLPDYYGYCDEHGQIAQAYDAALDEYYKLKSDRPHYTTSLDAALPGENIVLVRHTAGGKWIATHARNGMATDGLAHTEALARRIAALKGLDQ